MYIISLIAIGFLYQTVFRYIYIYIIQIHYYYNKSK